MTFQLNIQKHRKNELIHTNHRKGQKFEIEILFCPWDFSTDSHYWAILEATAHILIKWTVMSLKLESIMLTWWRDDPIKRKFYSKRDFLGTRNRENSVSSPTFLILFDNILKKNRIQVALIAFIELPLAEQKAALYLSVVIYNPNLRHPC